MNKIASATKTFIADENGVTAIEYGLIASLVGIAIAVAAKALGAQLSDAFKTVVTTLVS